MCSQVERQKQGREGGKEHSQHQVKSQTLQLSSLGSFLALPLTVQPRESYLTYLGRSFLIYKMEKLIVPIA